MKNYDEITKNLLSRRETFFKTRKKRIKIITSVSLCVVVLASALSIGLVKGKVFKTKNGESNISSDYNASAGNAQNTNDEFNWNATDATTQGMSIASITNLRTLYPELFNLSSNGGLTVHIWQTSKTDYRCFLISSASATKNGQTFSYKSGTTVSEMRAVLTTYGIAKDKVTVTPVKNSLSSYEYKIDAKYTKEVEKLFWEEENLIFSTVASGYNSEKALDFTAANESQIESGETKRPVYKIDSFEKLEEFKTALLNLIKARGAAYPKLIIESFETATKGFNSEYFDKNSLILTPVESSSTHRFDVQRLEINNNALNVHIVETTKAELVTADIVTRYVMVSVPKTLIKNCTEFGADVNDIAYLDKTIELKQKFPKYFGLDASNGLDLYFWKDSNNVNYCGLLPSKEGGYSEKTLSNLTKSGATQEEMTEIIRYYMKKKGVTRKTVTIKFLETSYSDAKDPDNTLAKSFSYSFWFSGRNPLMY